MSSHVIGKSKHLDYGPRGNVIIDLENGIGLLAHFYTKCRTEFQAL